MEKIPKREVVDKDTRWECQKCRKCCKTNKKVVQKIFKIKTEKDHCPFLKDDNCKLENSIPLICRLYPFFPGINEGKISFTIGKLTIFAGCSGIGKGKKVSENKELLKKIDKNAKELTERMVLKTQGKIKDVFQEKNEASQGG